MECQDITLGGKTQQSYLRGRGYETGNTQSVGNQMDTHIIH